MEEGKTVTKTLMIVAVIAVALSIVGLFTTLNKIGEIRQTGYAPQTQGNATLEVVGVASINFTNFLINWTTGSVNNTGACQPFSYTILNTSGGLFCSSTPGWIAVNNGLVLENDGSVNINLTLSSDKNAAQFIGGDSPVTPQYQWWLNTVPADGDGETGSCVAGFLDSSGWVDVSTTSRNVCQNFTHPTANDEIEIDLQIRIPQNAPVGVKISTITATATAIA
jgi:hypothetical protein